MFWFYPFIENPDWNHLDKTKLAPRQLVNTWICEQIEMVELTEREPKKYKIGVMFFGT